MEKKIVSWGNRGRGAQSVATNRGGDALKESIHSQWSQIILLQQCGSFGAIGKEARRRWKGKMSTGEVGGIGELSEALSKWVRHTLLYHNLFSIQKDSSPALYSVRWVIPCRVFLQQPFQKTFWIPSDEINGEGIYECIWEGEYITARREKEREKERERVYIYINNYLNSYVK